MTHTRDQLVYRVLLDLNVVANGSTAEAQDTTFVDDIVGTTCAELDGRDIVNINPDDDIDDALFEPLVEYLVGKCGPSYGRQAVPVETFLLIETRMKDVVRPSATHATLETDPVLRQGAWPRGLRATW